MQDMQLLSAFHEAGAVAGGDDVKNGMTYDQEFAYEEADAIAAAYARDEGLPKNLIRDLASEWLSGYQETYASQEHAD
jgi:hypothetical protein